jgi:hypothetical protein
MLDCMSRFNPYVESSYRHAAQSYSNTSQGSTAQMYAYSKVGTPSILQKSSVMFHVVIIIIIIIIIS